MQSVMRSPLKLIYISAIILASLKNQILQASQIRFQGDFSLLPLDYCQKNNQVKLTFCVSLSIRESPCYEEKQMEIMPYTHCMYYII